MKRLKNYLLRARHKLREVQNSFRPVESIFREVYEKRHWGNAETRSGSGSTIQQTQQLIKILPEIFESYKIKTVLDIPCGDFNWMKEVNLTGVDYKGADIVDEMIVENDQRYKKSNITFFKANILRDPLSKTDLILCRDCLVHFSDKDVWKAIENIKRSESTYLLTTTFPKHKNKAITTSGWQALNLQSTPFNFQTPLAIYNEGYYQDENADKSLGLWYIRDLPWK